MSPFRPPLQYLAFNKPLDFARTASMCGAMEQNGSYDFAAAFARLTCVFEDAAGVASEGQAAGLSRSRRTALAAELGAMHREAGGILEELESALGR